AVEPRRYRPARLIAAGAREALQERALDGVVGIARPEQSAGDREQPAAVALDQFGERRLVPLCHPLHEKTIAVHVSHEGIRAAGRKRWNGVETTRRLASKTRGEGAGARAGTS